MRKLLPLLLVLGAAGAQAQQATAPKVSPQTREYLYNTEHGVRKDALLHNYVYKTGANGQRYVSAMIKVDAGFNDAVLSAMGVRIGTKAGNIWTAQVPVEKVQQFATVSGIVYIALDEPAYPTMDQVRKYTRVDSVHQGINLPMPYNGDGVVVGIVDAGFDYTHPELFDTTGTGYRVKRVWEQQTIGTPPAGFAYGNEMTDSTTMWMKGTDDSQTHATHVTGIAAGSGWGGDSTGRKLRGIAYKSDLVFVGITPPKSEWVNTGVSDMIDGINYIFQYATSVSKPAVVNLSWGSPLGPHDGLGLFSQACDNLTGAGKIFACAAGNSGYDNIHISKDFSATDTVLHTFTDVPVSPAGKQTWIDVWGNPNQHFCVEIATYDSSTHAYTATTGYVCLDDSLHHFALAGSDGDTLYAAITTVANDFNGKPRIFVDLDNHSSNLVSIRVKGVDTGLVHLWNSYVYNTEGYYSDFISLGTAGDAGGDHDLSISDIAATKSAITVAAYVTRWSFTNIDNVQQYTSGTLKQIAFFSSHGPTSDGRIKPDIAAPGMMTISGVSSYDPTVLPGGSSYSDVTNSWHNPQNGRTYYFAAFAGTSMATPAVSGIVALLLEANPALTPDAIKTVFAETAILDNYTTALPTAGNTIWGHGKVNAYAALLKVLNPNSVAVIKQQNITCNLFPNPNSGSYTVATTSTKGGMVTMNVMDMNGRAVATNVWTAGTGYSQHRCSTAGLSKGIYFVQVSTGEGYAIIRMAIQ